MRVVVTGADGFLGRTVVDHLNEAGEDVLGIDLDVDLRDAERVRAVIADHEPSAVVHLGGISGPMVAADDAPLVTAVNATGTVHLLDACERLEPRPYVVVASSVAAVEQIGSRRPTTVYAATKRFGEDLVEVYRSRGMPAVAVRIGSLYGPGRRTDHIITGIADDLLANGRVRLGRDAREPLVHVQDAARFLAELVHRRALGDHPYHLVQAEVDHREIARLVATAIGIPLQIEQTDGPQPSWSEELDNRSLLAETALDFSVPIATGIVDLTQQVYPTERRGSQ
ncbi:NAD-dependent epimerase/dehydratase family protein [Microlunatus soli]|uniref:NAD dependent epimerase/dehydratase family protein n=1 Tax=Microlunatus soli TaxID=630515 RepID=A0A1H1YAB2_9ACTN|nr:NAD(P)-dependent oxidoreductase [Microlunatus soli]SDT18199.1 NAD dependent epimerase/dehydratase family protein [Microlunatus soli]